jgi:hypothetical protein
MKKIKVKKNSGFGKSKTAKTTTKPPKKNWEAYCETAFNNMNGNLKNWGKADYYRPITRTFYINVFDCAGVNHTGFISKNAIDYPKDRTLDHCLSPQFVGRMIMDNPEKFLSDYELFKNLFWLACSTVTVTKKENTSLSMLTENNGYDYKVYVPTNLKYNHLGIELYEKNGTRWKDSKPKNSNILDVPEQLLEYETQFLVV